MAVVARAQRTRELMVWGNNRSLPCRGATAPFEES